jgi:hypothetical protein
MGIDFLHRGIAEAEIISRVSLRNKNQRIVLAGLYQKISATVSVIPVDIAEVYNLQLFHAAVRQGISRLTGDEYLTIHLGLRAQGKECKTTGETDLNTNEGNASLQRVEKSIGELTKESAFHFQAEVLLQCRL